MINGISINQKDTCLAVTTTKGYRVINLKNLQALSDTIINKPLSISQMYYNTNIILYVLKDRETVLYFFDDFKKKVQDQLVLKHKIKRVIVRLDNVYVYTEANTLLVVNLYTMDIQKELIDIRNFPELNIEVPVKNEDLIAWNTSNSGSLSIYYKGSDEITTLDLHKTKVRKFCFNREGTMVLSLAKGTLAKVTDLLTGIQRKFWLNYGDIPISSISFSRSSDYIAIAETSGVIKILSLVNSENLDMGRQSLFKKVFKEGVFMTINGVYKDPICFFGYNDDSLYLFDKNEKVCCIQLSYDKKTYATTLEKYILPPIH